MKICGVTRAQDARLAARLGASAIGMLFWPGSPRAVTIEQARAVASALPDDVATVGVFVDAALEEIEAAVVQVPLRIVQLHGGETPDFARRVRLPVLKALALGPDDPDLTPWNGIRILVDAHDPVQRGGTGRVIDWRRAADIASRHDMILAGGLTPANIAEAITRVRPAGVDVSSGVEARPGVKDPDKLRALFEAIHAMEV